MINDADSREWKPLLPLVLVLVCVAIFIVLWSERGVIKECLAGGGPAPQYQLGKCYAYGVGTAPNAAEAVKWFRLAAAQGNTDAQIALARLYVQGCGVTQDFSAAATLLRQAANQGVAKAQNQLGLLYAQGKGVRQDLDEAATWFDKAARQGCRPATWNLKILATVRPPFLPSLTLRNGQTYRAVTVNKAESDSLTVTYRPVQGGLGMAKLAFKDLPVALQLKYGYDPVATAQFAATDRLLAVSLRTF